jgi:hypothetical protein
MSHLGLLAVAALLVAHGYSCNFNIGAIGGGSSNAHLLGIWFVGFGLLFLFVAFQISRKFRILRETPQMPIGSLTLGKVHIYGKAMGAERLTSPITRLPCFYYEVTVEEYIEAGRRSRFQKCLRDAGHVKFYLQDATGKVLIDLQEAKLDLSDTFRAEIGRHARQKRTVDPALRGWSGPLDRELLDYLSQANTKIHAARSAPHVSDSSAGNLKQGIAIKMIMESSHLAYKEGSVSTLATELPPDVDRQRIRFTEQCLLPDREYNVLGSCVENPNPTDEHDRKLIVRGPQEGNFLISSRAWPALLKRTQWTRFLLLVLGSVVTLAGIFLYLFPPW